MPATVPFRAESPRYSSGTPLRARSARALLTLRVALAVAAAATIAWECRPRSAPSLGEIGDAPGSEPQPVASEGSGETSGSGAVAGSVAPLVDAALQTCRIDSDCRVFQPSDWNADVECCYEYGCGLDYAAVNLETWAAVRAWRREHPFDCAEHVRRGGPCSNRPVSCGLDQTPPEAWCDAGLCRVAWPAEWPVVRGELQSCDVDADCSTFQTASVLPSARCCPGVVAAGEWVAINRATREELDAWSTAPTPACGEWLARQQCAAPGGTPDPSPPGSACQAGICSLRQ